MIVYLSESILFTTSIPDSTEPPFKRTTFLSFPEKLFLQYKSGGPNTPLHRLRDRLLHQCCGQTEL